MLLTSSNMQKFLSYFDLIPGMKYTEFCYFYHRGIPICIETVTEQLYNQGLACDTRFDSGSVRV